MRAKIAGLCIIASSAVLAQPAAVDRVLYLSRPASPQEVQEISSMIRTIPAIQNVAVDDSRGSIAVSGPAPQIALAEWLFDHMDKPAPSPAVDEYTVPGATDDVVRLFHLPQSLSVQEFQERSTLARTVANIRFLFTENPQRVMAIRGTAAQADLAAWLLKSLDPSPENAPRMSEYPQPLPGNRPGTTELVRVYRVANAPTPQEFQEISTLVRTISNIRTVFTENNQRAFALRADASGMAVADWMLGQIDKPADVQSQPAEYQVPGSTDDIVKVLYLPSSPTAMAFQQTTTAMRTASNVRTVFTYYTRKAVAMRGTSNQIALAERLVP